MDASGPIRPEERFDEERAAGYLQEQLPGLLGGSDIVFEQFHGGRANLTYLVRSGDAEVVLRRPPLGPLAPGSHDMAREYRVLSVLHEAFPEAPRAYHLCTDPSIIGAEFFVMERRRGHVVRAGWPSELDGSAGFKRQLGDGMIDTLVRLHSVDYRRIGLGDLGRPDGFLKRQVAGWTDRWERAKHEDVDAMTELAGRFAEEIPAPQIDAILHNDYRLDNVMVAGDGRVEAVFDWDMATTGDPLVDLGTTLAYWAEPEDSLFHLISPEGFALAAVMSKADVVERYARSSDLDLSNVRYYHSFGLFRVAVILQQIYIRYRRGQTSDERFAVFETVVPAIAEEARSTLLD